MKTGMRTDDNMLEVDHDESDRMCVFKVAQTNEQEVTCW
jgi:hypothetical protein